MYAINNEEMCINMIKYRGLWNLGWDIQLGNLNIIMVCMCVSV